MSRLAYLGVLAFALLGTAWLEVFLRTRVYARWRRLSLAVAPVVVVFVLWDLYAIAQNHWTFDPERTSGLLLPGGLPIDEVLFFIVIPIASVLTLEAVRSVKRWEVGDEVPGTCVNGVRVSDGER
ncbi:MAG: lycopene cyclase domain-containing protein [Actinobacteria bacterium]|nr:lycopene cyclase domain-containing protein [Actinomycetota bacterium]